MGVLRYGERMNWLCKEIQMEQDPDRFSRLVLELDALLGERQNALVCVSLNEQSRDQIIVFAVLGLKSLGRGFSGRVGAGSNSRAHRSFPRQAHHSSR